MPFIHTTVEQGELRGISTAGVVSFLGVPYGASTGGANRFRAPQPTPHWEGVRDAREFGPSAPQHDLRVAPAGALGDVLSMLMPRGGSPVEAAPTDEDCLRVNIWAPEGCEGAQLPVLVWLHGGGFAAGSGNEMSFNGDVLAKAGELVVVSVTHRLGLLGFLDLRELGEPESANAGMLDIVAALEWIRRNIHAFGGDPRRVTICGQSGGSGKVATLNAMPSARALFARSIMMSGPFGRPLPAEDAAAMRAQVLDAVGNPSVADLREAPLPRLLEVQAALRSASFLPKRNEKGLAMTPGFGPSIDAVQLPEDAFGQEPTDGVRGKELLIGWTTHEATFLLAAEADFSTTMTAQDAAQRVDALKDLDGVGYAELVERHPGEAPHLLLGRRLSWLAFEGPSRVIADQASEKAAGVWAYEFRQPTEVLDGLLGATHSLELAYVFGTVDRIPLTGRSLDRMAVSREMMTAWARFAHGGDPGWERWGEARHVHGFGASDAALPGWVDLRAPLALGAAE
ncbi:para-nitrobenzyl esterase [Microbacterium terrae]|uniref:Carboxylic ester hydrolase n=1 Tax=Microbacterium terrae TaxID=69369 RepID=A0A0M2H0I2_9MICO|nr:carboxylesterase family protein [Microbacterium terrae]KJL37520.1 Carboxylesterase [Microbacterium terrae]MBP1076349.1 para-nitrobenzyl esterase [Microbacterium terrae]GLJ97173.1 carboxylic ester hydrolase [Microbacterium terrae]